MSGSADPRPLATGSTAPGTDAFGSAAAAGVPGRAAPATTRTSAPASRVVSTSVIESREEVRARAAVEARAAAEAQARAAVQAQTEAAVGARRRRAAAEAKPEAEAAADAAVVPDRPDRAAQRPEKPVERQRLLGLHPGQIVTWEVAAAGALVGSQQPLPVLIPTVAVSAALVLLTAVRRRGRWLYQSLGLATRFATRRRTHSVAVDQDRSEAVLAALVRGGSFGTIEVDDSEVAVIHHAGGVTAVLAPTAAGEDQFFGRTPALPPMSDLLPNRDSDEPPVAAQIVLHTVPAPLFDRATEPASQSYQDLSPDGLPASRRCWVALQALYTYDDADDANLEAALTNAVRRVQRRLRKAGFRAYPLNRDELAGEFLTLSQLDPQAAAAAATAAPTTVQERWRSWSTSTDLHTTFRILDWPDLSEADGARLLDRLGRVPTLATTVSVAARRRGDAMDLEAAVRVVLPDAATADSTAEALREAAEQCGARLRRLDGEHVFGAAASYPVGGFVA